MSHHSLTALIGTAVAHLLHPHHAHLAAVHPFADSVKPLGGDTVVPEGADAYAEGKRRLQAGEVEAALAAFRQAAAEHPESADALNGLAVAWDRLGRPDLARLYYEAALTRAPDSASIQNNLGYSYLLAGEPERARSLLTRASLASDPRAAAAARRTLAIMDQRRPASSPSPLGQPHASTASPVRVQASPTALIERLSATRVALITQPAENVEDTGVTDSAGVGEAALTHPAQNSSRRVSWTTPPVQTRPAGEVLSETASRQAPVLIRASNPMGAERVDDAVLRGPVFDSDDVALNAFATRVHPFRARRIAATTTACAGPSPHPDAKPTAPIAPAAPEDPAALAGRIDAALRSPAPQDAEPLLDGAAGVLPAPLVALYRAKLALKVGDVDNAALAFAPLTQEPGIAPRAWAGLGEARLRQHRAGPAAEALDHALVLDPSLASAWVLRGVAADMLRDWRAADLAYDRAIALDPKSAAALTDRGYSRLLRGRFVEALADLKRAVELDPHSKAAGTDLRVASVMSGDYKGAVSGVGKEDVAEDLNTIGFAAMARGDYDRAETFFTRAMEINPKFDHVAWDNLVYLKQRIHASPGSSATP